MPLDQAFFDAALPEETGEVFASLLTIEHPDLVAPILLTNCGEDIVYASDLVDGSGNVAALAGTYVNFPIEIIPPGQSDKQLRGTLRVPNIDQVIGRMIDAISDPATITVAAVLASDHENIVGGPHRALELANVRGNALVVEGEVTRPSLTVQAYPRYWVRQSVYKGAYRI